MAKVLKADGSATNAYAQLDSLSLDLTADERWVTFGLGFTAAQLAAWNLTGSGFGSGLFIFINSFPGASTWLDVDGWKLESNVTDDTGGTPTADSLLVCELHLSPTLTEFYIGGVLVCSVVDGLSTLDRIRVGQSSAPDPSVAYFSDFKIGTTRGGSEDFADDFSSGDLSAWGSTSGTVSVVEDPFIVVVPIVKRKRFLSSKISQALTIKFVQNGPSDVTEIHLVELAARPLDPAEAQATNES